MKILTFHLIKEAKIDRKIEEYLAINKFYANNRKFTLGDFRLQLLSRYAFIERLADKSIASFKLPKRDGLTGREIFSLIINCVGKDEISFMRVLKSYMDYPWLEDRKNIFVLYHCRFGRVLFFTLLLDQSNDRALVFLSPQLRFFGEVYQRSVFDILCLIILSVKGYFALHAGFLAYDNKHGILLPGPSGCGKTTLTSGLNNFGFKRLTDERCFLGEEKRKIFTAFPCLEEHGGIHNRQQGNCFIPRVILFPEISFVKRSKLIPLRPIEAFEKLISKLPAYIISDKTNIASYFSVLRSLSLQCNSFILKSGMDAKAKPSNICNLIYKKTRIRQNNVSERFGK